jgi:hypothetical protein
VNKTVSIPEDLDCRCDRRTCHNRHGIVDALRKFQKRILDCAGFLIGCHSIPWPSVSRLRVTFHVLWQHLHASYPSQARESMDLNLAAAHKVLGVVDGLLLNPINFHVDDPSLLINSCSN